MNTFILRKMGIWRLLNQTPVDGCLLVFNAAQLDWRVKASDFKRRHGIVFSVHAVTGAPRSTAHDRTKHISDLYITVKSV